MSATVLNQEVALEVDQKRRWGLPIGLSVVAVISLVFFGLSIDSDARTSYRFSDEDFGEFVQIPLFSLPSQLTGVILSLIALVAVIVVVILTFTRRSIHWTIYAVFGVASVLALFTWAGAGKERTAVTVTALVVAGLVAAVPLVFGALAGLVCERSGVINIAIEGQLLAGAFLGAVVASWAGQAYVGLLAAPVAGALVGAILAVFAVRYWVDQIVVGVVLNVLVYGLTAYLYGTLLREHRSLNQPLGTGDIAIPVLSKIPILGPIFFNHPLLVYLMFVTVIILSIYLFKSRWGLRVRSLGEHPKAADTVGIRVNASRVRNVILGGALAGLGGAFYTVTKGLQFTPEMTGGAGFIALAAMILGRWTPKGALMAALLFGLADAFQQQLSIMGSSIPEEFVLMTPYLVTILAVAGLVGHARPPAAEGTPYKK